MNSGGGMKLITTAPPRNGTKTKDHFGPELVGRIKKVELKQEADNFIMADQSG
jgi:hypothetical protein